MGQKYEVMGCTVRVFPWMYWTIHQWKEVYIYEEAVSITVKRCLRSKTDKISSQLFSLWENKSKKYGRLSITEHCLICIIWTIQVQCCLTALSQWKWTECRYRLQSKTQILSTVSEGWETSGYVINACCLFKKDNVFYLFFFLLCISEIFWASMLPPEIGAVMGIQTFSCIKIGLWGEKFIFKAVFSFFFFSFFFFFLQKCLHFLLFPAIWRT